MNVGYWRDKIIYVYLHIIEIQGKLEDIGVSESKGVDFEVGVHVYRSDVSIKVERDNSPLNLRLGGLHCSRKEQFWWILMSDFSR